MPDRLAPLPGASIGEALGHERAALPVGRVVLGVIVLLRIIIGQCTQLALNSLKTIIDNGEVATPAVA